MTKLTWRGLREHGVAPTVHGVASTTSLVPSWPLALLPQAQTVPSLRTARLWLAPAAMWITFAGKSIAAGVGTSLLSVPFPTWPKVLSPHDQIRLRLLLMTTMLWSLPAARRGRPSAPGCGFVLPGSPVTAAGVVGADPSVGPRPSCPCVLSPHA